MTKLDKNKSIPKTEITTDSDTIKKIIDESIKTALKNLKDEVMEEIQAVKNSMEFINTNFEEFLTRLETNEKRIKKMEEEMALTKKTLKDDLMKPLTKIQASINELEIQNTFNNLEIVGIPYSSNENLNLIIDDISKQLNIPNNAKQGLTAHRQNKLPEKNNIILKLTSKENEDIWINNIKKEKNITNQNTKNKIYLNQQLTKNLKSLHWEIKQLKKTLPIEYVWIKDHRLFTRVKTGTPAISISSAEHIAQIINSCNKNQ